MLLAEVKYANARLMLHCARHDHESKSQQFTLTQQATINHGQCSSAGILYYYDYNSENGEVVGNTSRELNQPCQPWRVIRVRGTADVLLLVFLSINDVAKMRDVFCTTSTTKLRNGRAALRVLGWEPRLLESRSKPKATRVWTAAPALKAEAEAEAIQSTQSQQRKRRRSSGLAASLVPLGDREQEEEDKDNFGKFTAPAAAGTADDSDDLLPTSYMGHSHATAGAEVEEACSNCPFEAEGEDVLKALGLGLAGF